MPGMSANSSIFELISLPAHLCELHYLKWIDPILEESIFDYSKRLSKYIEHDNIVLIGVSFGGLIVQEIYKIINVEKLIIISSIKSNLELPLYMKSAKFLKLYNYFPLQLFDDVFSISKVLRLNKVYKKLDLVDKYLTIRNENYMKWSIREILNWKQSEPPKGIVHIHGDKDLTFPISLIKNCIVIPNGNHAIILTKHRLLNKLLTEIIE
jgi:pimeloyl-ACP methyl ester carboxylesterase